MRLIVLLACTALFGASPAVAQEFDASSLEQSLTSHPDRFGEDDFRIIDRNDDRPASAEEREPKDRAAPQTNTTESISDDGRGENGAWDGESKDDERSQ